MARNRKDKLSPRRRRSPSLSSSRSVSYSSSSSSSSSSSAKMASGLKTVFIDSEHLKGRGTSARNRARSQSILYQRNCNASKAPSSPRSRDYLPSRRNGRRGQRPRNISRDDLSSSCTSSTSSIRSSSISSSSSSSRRSKSSLRGSDVSRVRVFKLNPDKGRGVTEEGRMFVYDSKKYKIETIPDTNKRSRYYHRKSGNWSRNGVSHIVYEGKGSEPIYLVEVDPR